MTATTENFPDAPAESVDGLPPEGRTVPPTAPPLPGIPDWVPPTDSGQPLTSDINDVSQFRRLVVAAENTVIPECYGRDRFSGAIMALDVSDTTGLMHIAYGFCRGEIQGFERIYIDSVDRLVNGSAYIGLKNRGWENGDDSGWNTGGSNSGTVNSTVSRTGTFGLNILCAAGGPNRFSDRIPSPIEGTVVRLKAHAQRNSIPTGLPDADCRIRVRTATTVGGSLTVSGDVTVITNALQGTSGFQLMEITWVVPAGIVEYVMDLGESSGTQGSWDIDDMSTEVLADDSDAVILTADAIEIVAYRGEADQPVDSLLEPLLTGYTDKNDNLAYMVLRIPVEAVSGFPRVEAVIQGKKIYDLRKDDTSPEHDPSLGVTTHRIGDTSTWEFTKNPSICFADFVFTFTDWVLNDADLAENATHNDVLISGVPRREMGLSMFRPNTADKWMRVFRIYCGAYFAWEAGKIRVITDRADVEAPGAVIFDGTSGTLIDVGDQAILDMDATQDFTLELNFKMPSNTPQQFLVSKKNFASAGNGYAFYMQTGGNLRCVISDGTIITDETTQELADDEWHHVAMTVDRTGDEMIFYVDGVARTPVDISTVTGSLASSTSFRMGARGGNGSELTGLIDEVRIWDVVRTPSEIVDNANNEIPDPASETNLIGYWKLNDVTGSIVVDSSSEANNGTLAGAVGFTTGNIEIIPDGVVRHFTADDINNRGFRLNKKPNRSFPTQVQVEYTDQTGKNWPIVRQRASAPGVEEGTAPKRISKISLPGIHNASQAKRTAIERLNWFLSDLECSLPVFDEGLEIQQGSIVAVTHPIGLAAKLFRVRKLTGQSGRWILDLTEYDPQIYSDAVIVDPTFPDTNLGDPLNPPVVTGLVAVEELYTTKEGNTGSRVRVNWDLTNYPFVSQYRVEGLVSGVIVWNTFVSINEAISPGVEQLVGGSPVTYDVNVYIYTGFSTGPVANTDVLIQGKLAAPSNVPAFTSVRISADTVKLSWQTAIDIDIWRYEVRQGTTAQNWDTASPGTLELVDGLNFVVEGLAANTTHRFFVKAIDSVRNESVTEAFTDINLALPTPVVTLNGFEIGGEVRLNWTAPPADPFVARYRIARVDFPTPTTETTLDVVDTLTFNTKDVPAGDYTFRIYSQDGAGNESATSADKVITVTLDTDAFLADSFDFISPTLTNMVEWDLRLDDVRYYVTNMGNVFAVSPSDFVVGDPLANYHSLGAGEWLSETKDFGLLLTGNWLLTQDVTVLNGNVTIDLELSVAGFGTDSTTFTSGIAKGAFRFGRVRISTFNPPGDDTAFVKSPLMNLKVNVVPLEESASAFSSAAAGKVINLSREYTALKEVNVQPKNSIDGLMAIVDNIIIGLNTGVQTDTTNYLDAGDLADLDFGASQDFSIEFLMKHSGGAQGTQQVVNKRNGVLAGWTVRFNEAGEDVLFIIDDGTNQITVTLTDACPNDGNWHHIAFTVDRTGDLVRGYVDGIEDTGSGSPFSSASVTGSLDSGTAPFRIFANNTAGQHWDNGLVDELRIWDDIRSASEIADNDQKELDMTQTQSNLIHYWQMNGKPSDSVTTIADRTGGVTADLTDTGAGDIIFIDVGDAGNDIVRINSFDVYIFDIFGQQLLEEFQWNWKAV